MAASESEFSMSSSSKSPSAAPSGFCSPPSSSSLAALNGVAAAGAAGGAGVCASSRRAGDRHARHRHNRLAVGADHRTRHRLGVGTRIGRLEIDDVAQEDLSLVELVAPDDDGLEGERALAQPGDHRLAAGLDALGDRDLALARQAAPPSPSRAGTCAPGRRCARPAPWPRIWPGPSAGPRPARRSRPRAPPPASSLLALLLARLLGLDHVDAHLAEHGENVLDLLGIDLLGGQDRVDLVMGDVAALLGGADELLDGRVGEVEQRQRRVGRLGGLLFRRLFLFFLFLCRLGLARHYPRSSHAGSRSPGGRHKRPPYPMQGESNGRKGSAHRRHHPDSPAAGVSPGPIKPRLTLHTAETAGLFPGSPGPTASEHSPCSHKVRAGRPEEAPKPSIIASVPSMTERRAFTSCNQE